MKKLLRKSEQRLIFEVRQQVVKYFKNADGCHDMGHVERVVETSLLLGRKLKADLFVLELAALLHDLGRKHQDLSRGKSSHVERGTSQAERILRRTGIERSVVPQILHCIAAHSFKRGVVAETLEAKILFDADKLDSLGAIGLGRSFLFAGKIGARLHNTKNAALSGEEYSKEDTAYREYVVKDIYIPQRMHTVIGKKIARERLKVMRDFFEQLEHELRGLL